MNLSDMAKAHLGNVQVALNDLVKQKEKIEQEINRLVEYLKEGESIVLDYEHVNAQSVDVSNVTDKSSNFLVPGDK